MSSPSWPTIFNNLLTAIGVCVDLLKSRLPTGSLERHYVEDIETAATRAADLTRLLQAVSHKPAEPRVAFPVES